jgi:hypothetical protein
LKPIIESIRMAIIKESAIAIKKPTNASYRVTRIWNCMEVKPVTRLMTILLGAGSIKGGKIPLLESISHSKSIPIKNIKGKYLLPIFNERFFMFAVPLL